jgi:hypothetical protein
VHLPISDSGPEGAFQSKKKKKKAQAHLARSVRKTKAIVTYERKTKKTTAKSSLLI